jgi:SAM-dependent methyltransferase
MTAIALRSADAAAGMVAHYEAKSDSYFAGARADFVAELPVDAHARILEAGCGSGDTGRLALAAGKAGHYAGIDISEKAAAKARAILSEVVVGDVERMALPWEASSFDALILSEVLEHLIEPWTALSRLSGLIKPGGLALASSPNVSHYHVVASLLRGSFDLADQGTFDRTHMRWFTPRTYAAMFEAAGFRVETVKPLTPFAPRTRALSRLTGGRIDHLFMRQIWLKARKA